MLMEYLENNYKKNEPIFLSDINLPVSNNNLRQMFKNLCDSGKIERFDTGIYYIKGDSRIKGGSSISSSDVAEYKYISRLDKVDGYYSGYTFANQLGLSTQVPYVTEIVSNNASAKCREVTIKNKKVLLRKPRTTITRENFLILQLLDLIKDLEQYIDNDSPGAEKAIKDYIRLNGIRREDIDKYISLFPERIYRYIYEFKLYEAFV